MRHVRRVLIAAVAVGATAWAAALSYIVARNEWPSPAASDAVVVLGTSSIARGGPNPCMATRVREGVRLVQRGLAPVMVVSGGFDPRDGLIEAETMRAIALDLGLSDEAILVEDQATSTIENLTFSLRLLGDVERPRVLVVTEPFHLPRAVFAAERLGIDAVPAPTTGCPGRDLRWMVREPAALLWYRWKLR